MKKFRGESDGCGYCDFYQYAKKDHFCQRGKHMGYRKCGWYYVAPEGRHPALGKEDSTAHNTAQPAIAEQTVGDGIAWSACVLRQALLKLERQMDSLAQQQAGA